MIRAKYTVVLRTLMDDPQLKQQLDLALAEYPLYAPEKLYDLIPTREALNAKLLNHYKYREIGFETIGMFLDELKITMGEIMPRYNELFKTVETMANLPSPFDNVDVIETFEQEKTNNTTIGTTSETTTTGTTEGSTETTGTTEDSTQTTGTAEDSTQTTGTATSHNKHINSKTPQEKLSITAEEIDAIDYADEAQWNKDTSSTSGSSTSNGSTSGTSTSNGRTTGTTATTGETTETTEGSANVTNEGNETTRHTYTKKGNQGVNTYAHDMIEFRTSIIDVVDQIVNDSRIRELFMLVY